MRPFSVSVTNSEDVPYHVLVSLQGWYLTTFQYILLLQNCLIRTEMRHKLIKAFPLGTSKKGRGAIIVLAITVEQGTVFHSCITVLKCY